MTTIRLATADELADWDERTVDAPGGHVYQSRAWAEHRARSGWAADHLVFGDEGDGYAAADEINVELDISDDAITMAIGPLNGDAVRADLEQSSDGDLGLGRLLATLVEDAAVEAREDGDWLRLAKRVRGVKPAGTNA